MTHEQCSGSGGQDTESYYRLALVDFLPAACQLFSMASSRCSKSFMCGNRCEPVRLPISYVYHTLFSEIYLGPRIVTQLSLCSLVGRATEASVSPPGVRHECCIANNRVRYKSHSLPTSTISTCLHIYWEAYTYACMARPITPTCNMPPPCLACRPLRPTPIHYRAALQSPNRRPNPSCPTGPPTPVLTSNWSKS